MGSGEPVLSGTVWERGRFDARSGPRKILFGRMYEDVAIERAAFAGQRRVFCIASAGCTAMALAQDGHEVVAVDINPDQLAYAEHRLAGAPAVRGTAERVMAFGRTFAPLVGWSAARVKAFCELDDPAEQLEFWRAHLDTRRFRTALRTLFSSFTLRTVYASPFLAFLPPRLGMIMRGRMERCFARHPNRTNPYARLLLLGELEAAPAAPGLPIELVCADAASWLEAQPPQSFDAFTLSNILDGADEAYGRRLYAAIARAARPGAVAVLRSFAEPPADAAANRAADDRAMLWGEVWVLPAAEMAAALERS